MKKKKKIQIINTRYKILHTRYKQIISWILAFAIVLPPYLTVFSPFVFAKLQEAVKDFGGNFTEKSSKYAFIGIDTETGTEVFFFDGSENIKITNNGVTDGNAQYDEFSNKIVYQSLIDGIWQIFLYDVATDTTVQLSHDGTNNTDPQISQGQVTWQSWVDGAWEVYFYDGLLSQRLTFNETHDIEPKISNGYVIWRYYDDVEFGKPDDINADAYEMFLYDSFKKERKRLTTDKIGDNSVNIEYPYIVWKKYDGNDDEIVVHYIDKGNTAFLTNNDYDDLSPKIKNGKVKWLENVKKVIRKKPENLIKEDGQIKLKPQPLPEELPEWWNNPQNCPSEGKVCSYIDGIFTSSYPNRCFAEKAGVIVLHTGVCTGDEEIPFEVSPTPTSEVTVSPFLSPSPTAFPSEEIPVATPTPEISVSPLPTPQSDGVSPEQTASFTPSPIASPSETFSPSPTASPSEDIKETVSPIPSPPLPSGGGTSPVASPSETEETVSPLPSPEASPFVETSEDESEGEASPIVSPSQPFETPSSPSPEPAPLPEEEEDIYSEPGTYQNTGSFNEEGDLIIEEHIPADWIEVKNDINQPASGSGSLPIVEDSEEPVVFEESTIMKVGETINNAVTNTVGATANILINLVPSPSATEDEAENDEPAQELIEVIEEPVE